MRARIYGGIPLTLMMATAILHSGAAAGWWPGVMPEATLLTTAVAWALGLWLLWQIDTPRPHPTPPLPQPAPAASKPVCAPVCTPAERRSTPRFAIRAPVELDLAEHGAQRGELLDISQGGARIAGIPALPRDTQGVLRIPGITLPVPFMVVGAAGSGEIRVRFALSGLGLETFLRQFDRLVVADSRSAFTQR